MDWLHIVTGPLIGGAIGYFTNYIAVKMLFRPHREKKLFGKTLPFTPGIIPKRKGDLARAIGNAVETSLFGKDDIKTTLLSDETVNGASDGICDALRSILSENKTFGALIDTAGCEGFSKKLKEKAMELISQKASEKIKDADIGGRIAEVEGETVKESLRGSPLALFVSPKKVDTFLEPVRDKINEYVETEGFDGLMKTVSDEIDILLSMNVGSAFDTEQFIEDKVRPKVKEIYKAFISSQADKFMENFRIGKTVEDKINAMDVADFEKLVLDVMKHELSMIVNLGAVLGFLIGVINIFV